MPIRGFTIVGIFTVALMVITVALKANGIV